MDRSEGRPTPEEILPAAASGFRRLIEELPAAFRLSLLDPSLSTIYVSPQIEMLTGYPASQWMDDPEFWLSVIHADDRQRMVDATAKHVSSGWPISEEYRIVTRRDTDVWIREESRVIVNDGGPLIASIGVMFDVTERKGVEEQLEENIVLRHALAARLVRAEEEERARVAAEIHDAAIQVMSDMNTRLNALTRTLTDEHQAVELRDVTEMAEGVIHRLGRLSFDVSPLIKDAKSLAAGIRQFLIYIVEPTGVATHLDDRLTDQLSPEARIAAYRITKEALNNVRLHAYARNVVVALETHNGGVLVAIEDNGKGFDVDKISEAPVDHLGLQVMRERAEMAGGWLRVDSPVGRGTTIEFWIPSTPVASSRP